MCSPNCSAGPDATHALGSDGGGSAATAASGGPPALTSLEHLATTQQALNVSVQSQAAHSRYESKRLPILAALADSPDLAHRKLALRMADCCSTPAVGLTAAGCVGAIWFRCRVRHCPLCAQARSRQAADRIMKATRNADSLRFLTLTQRSSSEPLKVQLDRLYEHYRNFRRTVGWKRHVDGGIATLEVTFNRETGEWHPHLHVLIDGRYWSQNDIANEWERCTGDSRICDIRAVNSRLKSARYVAKYAAKSGDPSEWPPHVIREYVDGLHRRRMIIATGNMHGSKLDCDDEHERDLVQGERIPLHALERRTQHGCVRASIVLTALAQQSAAYYGSLCKRPPSLKPNLLFPSERTLALAADAFADLRRYWSDDPAMFTMGGSGDWVRYTPPKRPPGTGKMKNHTDAIADWHLRNRPHW